MKEEAKVIARFPGLPQPFIAGRRKIRYDRTITGLPTEKNTSKAAGFTLVELVITLAIIAIVAGIAYPTFQKFAVQGKLKAAARELMGDFANMKARAMAENVSYEITFNVAGNSYSMQASTGGPIITKSPSAIDKGVSIDSAAPGLVTLDTRGTMTNGTYVLKNAEGSTATITTAVTGRTYVEYNFK
jgi:prepilin-type N-terminal cleavage/methylation domain-containing protein